MLGELKWPSSRSETEHLRREMNRRAFRGMPGELLGTPYLEEYDMELNPAAGPPQVSCGSAAGHRIGVSAEPSLGCR